MEAEAKSIMDEIREIIRDLGKGQKELQESRRETEESHKKTEASLREYRREMGESHKKTEASLREFQRETQKVINKTNGNFNNKWGAFMESLVGGALVKLLNERNISVAKILSRVNFHRPDGNEEGEFDLVAINGEEVVVVEVKTTLTTDDVDHFIKKLERFKEVFTEYRDKKIYGGVAYLESKKSPPQSMEEKGLFVIKALGKENLSTIINASDFVPKSF